MTDFDNQTLEHLKKLCKIECNEEDAKALLDRLKRILAYTAQLQEVDTEGVKTCRYVLRGMLKNNFREDEVKDLLAREKLLSNAPDQIGGLVRVPPILKTGIS